MVQCAIAIAKVWKSRRPDEAIGLTANGSAVILKLCEKELEFASSKGLEKQAVL